MEREKVAGGGEHDRKSVHTLKRVSDQDKGEKKKKIGDICLISAQKRGPSFLHMKGEGAAVWGGGTTQGNILDGRPEVECTLISKHIGRGAQTMRWCGRTVIENAGCVYKE